MRLLNIHSFELQDFTGHTFPRYTILSHRWGDDEVTYREFRKGQKKGSAGYRKIVDFCAVVKHRSIASLSIPSPANADSTVDWVWVDTCCIDKRSSAELSEAVNSMYSWYRNAYECLVHLNDVVKVPGQIDRDGKWPKSFGESAWFRRGWTLQELLAPRTLLFYNAAWELLGHHQRIDYWNPAIQRGIESASVFGRGLLEEVCEAAKIPQDYLSGAKSLRNATVAQRMSWAADRRTTRIEDEAYCLLGIFGISMSLLYGEGRGAFIRLQQEILRRTVDLSILSWNREFHSTLLCSWVLAMSPRAFCGVDDAKEQAGLFHQPFTVTNNGIELLAKQFKSRDVTLPIHLSGPWYHTTLYETTLNYSRADKEPVRIFLVRIKQLGKGNFYMRVLEHDLPKHRYEHLQWKEEEEEVIHLLISPDLVGSGIVELAT